MKQQTLLLLFSFLFLLGCNNSQTNTNDSGNENGGEQSKGSDRDTEYTVIDSSGLMYKTLEKGTGERIDSGDVVIFHYKGRPQNDDRFFSNTFQSGSPSQMEVGQVQMVDGMNRFFPHSREGGRYILKVPSHLGFGNKIVMRVPSNSDLHYEIQVLGKKKSVAPLDTAGAEELITNSGLKIYKVSSGDGARPAPGDLVKIHYNGYFKSGLKFDSSFDRDKPLVFNLGQGQVVRGLDEAVSMMRQGDQWRVVIPSYLGYGEQGKGVVGPDKDLIFDVELIDFKKPE
jgi:FKBP-type peptidyl-prolyl cis-trans isomerase